MNVSICLFTGIYPSLIIYSWGQLSRELTNSTPKNIYIYPDLSRNVCATWWNTTIFKKDKKKMLIGNVTFWNCLIIWYFGPNNTGSQNSIKEVQILLRTNWLKFKLKLIAAYQIVYLYLGYQSINCHCSYRKREVPLIFGELICFSEKAWSCWSSFWRASLALSESISYFSESFSTAWTIKEGTKQDWSLLVLLKPWPYTGASHRETTGVVFLLVSQESRGSGDCCLILQRERQQKESIWTYKKMKPEPLHQQLTIRSWLECKHGVWQLKLGVIWAQLFRIGFGYSIFWLDDKRGADFFGT